MSNQAEIDYDKQFQDDLAKATALSLEQEALDEFNRTKKYGAAFTKNTQQEAQNKYYAQIRRQHYARTGSTDTNSSMMEDSPANTPKHLALPKLQSQRRHSEITNNATVLLTDVERSKTPPAASTSAAVIAAQNDLINFASPTSKNPENTSFEKLIEDLQKLHATNPQSALVPLGPTAAAPVYPAPAYHPHHHQVAPSNQMYAGSAAAVQPPAQYGVTTAAGAMGMQLVPFTPPAQQQKVPLTNDELKKLYNMPPSHSAPIYGQRHPMGFVTPMAAGGYYPATPPIMPASAAYTAPMQYANAYGYQYQAVGAAGPQPFYPSNMSSSNVSVASSSSAASFVRPNHIVNSSPALSSNHSFNQVHSINVNVNPSTNQSSAAPPPSSSVSQSNGLNTRRQTPPVRKSSRVPGSDLIDLMHEDDSRVSVLEAFDPLLNEGDDVTKRLTKKN